MKLPENLHELFEPSPTTFINGWETEFGSFRWFYLSGIRRLFTEAAKADIDFFAPKYKHIMDNINQFIPKNWIEDFHHLVWAPIKGKQHVSNLAKAQIQKVYKSGAAVTLDRAGAIIAYLNAVVDENEVSFDVLDYVKIHPAIFVLEGFNEELFSGYFDDWNSPESNELKRITGQTDKSFFKEILLGYPATHETLTKLGDYIYNVLGVKSFKNTVTPIRYRSAKDRGLRNYTDIKMFPAPSESVD